MSELAQKLRAHSNAFNAMGNVDWIEISDAFLAEAAARIERLEAALREIMGMDEVAIVDFKKGDGWLHQRVARAALKDRT